MAKYILLSACVSLYAIQTVGSFNFVWSFSCCKFSTTPRHRIKLRDDRQRDDEQCSLPEKINGITYKLLNTSTSKLSFRTEPDRVPEGSVLLYTCEEGFMFPNGTDETTVCKNGNWIDTPICIHMSKCLLPEKLIGTRYTLQADDNPTVDVRRAQEWVPDGSILVYSCEEGFVLPDMADIISVCNQGTWTRIPKCTLIIQNSQMNDSSSWISAIDAFLHQEQQQSTIMKRENISQSVSGEGTVTITRSETTVFSYVSSTIQYIRTKLKNSSPTNCHCTSTTEDDGKIDASSSTEPLFSWIDVTSSTPTNSDTETPATLTAAPTAPTAFSEITKLVANMSDEFPSPFPSPPICGSIKTNSNTTLLIINGSPTEVGDWPWMVAYGYRTRSGLQYLCGGSLITDRHTITAAHCVNVPGRRMVAVRMGIVNLDDEESGITIGTLKAIVYPNYRTDKRTGDLAIVTLKSAVSFSDAVRPVCLPFPSRMCKDDFPCGSLSITGWGKTEDGRPSRILKEAKLSEVSQSECQNKFDVNAHGIIIDEKAHLCAVGEDGQDSCQGDSGGPLVQPWRYHYYLIGIISFGRNCGVKGMPGVNVRITSYLDWIVNVTSTDTRLFNSSANG